MAKLVYALNVSLDGYVDHDKFAPDPVLFRHFIEDIGTVTGCLYGGRMYDIMRYWDDEHPGQSPDEAAYAAAWRSRPKWVASRTLNSVGPNATLLGPDLETAVRTLKAEHEGDIEIAGPKLARSLVTLIDEYRLYLHPVVLGTGTPYFAAPRPPLRLSATDRIGTDVVRLTYVPA